MDEFKMTAFKESNHILSAGFSIIKFIFIFDNFLVYCQRFKLLSIFLSNIYIKEKSRRKFIIIYR